MSGEASGKYKNTIDGSLAIAAAIGNKTNATIAIGNVGSKGTLSGSGHVKVNSVSNIAAAIGQNSNATISVGNIRDTIHGSTSVDIKTGPIIAATLGYKTSATVSVGDVNKPIRGYLKSDINVGAISVFSLGSHAVAEAYIGTIDAPIYGNVNIDIKAGEIFVGALGLRNSATTHIGYVGARNDGRPYGKNIDINISVGNVNNFSIGASTVNSGIDSRISIGSILSNSATNSNKAVKYNHKGPINTFSIGVDFDIPLIGRYFLGETGCISAGDVGSTCTGNDNKLRFTKQ